MFSDKKEERLADTNFVKSNKNNTLLLSLNDLKIVITPIHRNINLEVKNNSQFSSDILL